ncbi:class I SAM-dependent methyltransferase [Apibacter raozihei]|uniref:class I SAM-dependent methyltransferase n=1 Tax=Apibacter raozihei TaxID=2500547 RepID=UPI000FE2D4AF|nr:class I SAM-dependent methyltransferase [Apibacter raozihei]
MKKEKNYEELADQLRCPNGEKAIETAENMFKSNSLMIYKTIDTFTLQPGWRVLEIGFGNGKHLDYLFDRESDILYYGVDISQAMVTEALKNNAVRHSLHKASFFAADGQNKYDFQDSYFNVCFTVNTIYFIDNPEFFFKEIYRVLKPNGLFSLAFIEKSLGVKLPFTQKGFTFYEKEEIEMYGNKAGFKNFEYQFYSDNAVSKDGQKLLRPYIISTMQK